MSDDTPLNDSQKLASLIWIDRDDNADIDWNQRDAPDSLQGIKLEAFHKCAWHQTRIHHIRMVWNNYYNIVQGKYNCNKPSQKLFDNFQQPEFTNLRQHHYSQMRRYMDENDKPNE